jgi:hypothetical protein
VYISQHALGDDPQVYQEELQAILAVARKLNELNHLTGALLFDGGRFVQALEGPRSQIELTFERIQCDTRHHALVILNFEPIEKRCFDQWTMAYYPRETDAALRLSGLVKQLPDCQGGVDGEAVYELLLEHMRSAVVH